MNRKQIMTRAWQLVRDPQWGYQTFGEALRDAWAEARGEISFVVDEAPAVDRDALIVLTMGAIARQQIFNLAG